MKVTSVILFVLLIIGVQIGRLHAQELMSPSPPPTEYWFNFPSSPVRIVVELKGTQSGRPDEFLENVSYGSISALQLGCVIPTHDGYDVVRENAEEKFDLSPACSTGSKQLLPKASHGGYLSKCRDSAKVAILSVTFADGGKWTFR